MKLHRIGLGLLLISTYTATLTIQAAGINGVAPMQVPVTLVVAEQVERVFLPVIVR